MQLLYNTNNGDVYYAVYSKDIFQFIHTTNIPLSEFIIDEVNPDNKNLCLDLKRTEWKFDKDGKRKYYIQNGELFARDNWTEYIEI